MALAKFSRTTSGQEFANTPVQKVTPAQSGKGTSMTQGLYQAKVKRWENVFSQKMDKLKAQFLEGKINKTQYHTRLAGIYDKMKGDAPNDTLKYKYRVAVAQQMQRAKSAARGGGGGSGGYGGSRRDRNEALTIEELLDKNTQQVGEAKKALSDGKIDTQQYITELHTLKDARVEVFRYALDSPAVKENKKEKYQEYLMRLEKESADVQGSTSDYWFGGINYMNEHKDAYVTKQKSATGEKYVELDEALVGTDRAYSPNDGKEYVQGSDGAYYEIGNLLKRDSDSGNYTYFDQAGEYHEIEVDDKSGREHVVPGSRYRNPLTGRDEIFSEDPETAEAQFEELKSIESVKVMDAQQPKDYVVNIQSEGSGWKPIGSPIDHPTAQQPSLKSQSREGEDVFEARKQGVSVSELRMNRAKKMDKDNETLADLKEQVSKSTIAAGQQKLTGKKTTAEDINIDVPEFKQKEDLEISEEAKKAAEEEAQRQQRLSVSLPEHQTVGEIQNAQSLPGEMGQQQQSVGMNPKTQGFGQNQLSPFDKLKQAQGQTSAGYGNFKSTFKTDLKY